MRYASPVAFGSVDEKHAQRMLNAYADARDMMANVRARLDSQDLAEGDCLEALSDLMDAYTSYQAGLSHEKSLSSRAVLSPADLTMYKRLETGRMRRELRS
jgi:hypothetical protein